MNSPHEKHRERLKERYLNEGLDSFAEHNILELILGYSIPRKDTNEYAHDLINTFGSLKSVFDANISDLIKVKGITLHSAILLKTYADMQPLYKKNFGRKQIKLTDEKQIIDFLVPLFEGSPTEKVLMLCFDSHNSLKQCVKLHDGNLNSVTFQIRTITEIAIRAQAAYIILAHNHPSGSLIPSSDDINTTRQIMDSLASNDICIKEHFIIAGNSGTPLIKLMYSI
ncbi:MAG: JAB domain-containing protein [Clostridia bacterium]